MGRFQRGSLRKEDRKAGLTWVLRHYVTRQSDGKRVEHKIPVGLVRDLKTESAAWAEVERQHLTEQINEPSSHNRVLFSDIAYHYIKTELPERAPTTAYLHRHIVNDFLIPRWGKRIAVGLKPLEVEEWLKALPAELEFSNPTCAKMRAVMACVYKHAQRHGLIPRSEEANPSPSSLRHPVRSRLSLNAPQTVQSFVSRRSAIWRVSNPTESKMTIWNCSELKISSNVEPEPPICSLSSNRL